MTDMELCGICISDGQQRVKIDYSDNGDPIAAQVKCLGCGSHGKKVDIKNLSFRKDAESELTEEAIKTWNEAQCLIGLKNR